MLKDGEGYSDFHFGPGSVCDTAFYRCEHDGEADVVDSRKASFAPRDM
jgi:hypothetical protein